MFAITRCAYSWKHDRQPPRLAVAHDGDVVDVLTRHEQPPTSIGLPWNFGLNGVNARSCGNTMTTVGTAVEMARSVSTRLSVVAEGFELDRDVAEVPRGQVADRPRSSGCRCAAIPREQGDAAPRQIASAIRLVSRAGFGMADSSEHRTHFPNGRAAVSSPSHGRGAIPFEPQHTGWQPRPMTRNHRARGTMVRVRVFGPSRPAYWTWLVIVVAAMLTETAMTLASPWPLKIVLDSVLDARPVPASWQWLTGGGAGPAGAAQRRGHRDGGDCRCSRRAARIWRRITRSASGSGSPTTCGRASTGTCSGCRWPTTTGSRPVRSSARSPTTSTPCRTSSRHRCSIWSSTR